MRLGVLDVGSNTVHLQIVDTSPGARPNPTFNYKEELKLTQYISEDNLVSDEGIEKLRSCIKRAIEQSASVQTQELLPFATSALREASNGEEIINSINKAVLKSFSNYFGSLLLQLVLSIALYLSDFKLISL